MSMEAVASLESKKVKLGVVFIALWVAIFAAFFGFIGQLRGLPGGAGCGHCPDAGGLFRV